MKKIIASMTVLCYLAVTCGVIVNFHYCMDQFSSVQFFTTENKDCSTCGMHINKSHGCCRDEVKIITMKVDQKAPSTVSFSLPALDAMTTLPSRFICASFHNMEETGHYQNHSPPLLSEQETYLQNGVFRI